MTDGLAKKVPYSIGENVDTGPMPPGTPTWVVVEKPDCDTIVTPTIVPISGAGLAEGLP